MEKALLVLLCVFYAKNANASRILVAVPTPSISHQVVFRPIINELLKRGHDVTYITTDPMYPAGNAPKNLTEVNVNVDDESYKIWRRAVLSDKFSTGSSDAMVYGMMTFFKIIVTIFEQQMQTPEMKYALTKEYDLLVLEAWVKPVFILTHFYKDVPTILVSSFNGINGNYETVGAPVYPALLYPTFLHQKLSDLSLWVKLKQLYTRLIMDRFYITQDEENNKLFKKMLGPNAPTVSDLQKNVDMFFANYYPIWDFNRPVPPSLVYIGGIHQNPSRELSKVRFNLFTNHENTYIMYLYINSFLMSNVKM